MVGLIDMKWTGCEQDMMVGPLCNFELWPQTMTFWNYKVKFEIAVFQVWMDWSICINKFIVNLCDLNRDLDHGFEGSILENNYT